MYLLFDLLGESCKKLKGYPKLTFLQSFDKFQNMDPEIQILDEHDNVK